MDGLGFELGVWAFLFLLLQILLASSASDLRGRDEVHIVILINWV